MTQITTRVFNGICIAIAELLLFAMASTIVLGSVTLTNLDLLSFYWAMFTILTGIWEVSYIILHKKTAEYAVYLINNSQKVWTNKYSITTILPWKLAIIFYAQYGAYADREYMLMREWWSRLIEGTHALYCGMFSLIAISLNVNGHEDHSQIALAVAMGTQLMNSILYMGEYNIQTKDPESPNYDCQEFPCGFLLCKRRFMYVNVFWTLMPTYVIIQLFV
jgi:hypothetical protein